MATAALVLLLVALAVWLSATRPSYPFSPDPADRDRERQLAELRAMAGSRADLIR
jgi:hypothetical protein